MTSVEPPPTKRSKVEDVLSVVSSEVLKAENEIGSAYLSAKPFPHGRIENMFVEGFLEKVLDEIRDNSKVKFKESDLFRVYQSIDLANLAEDSPEAQKLPSVMQLRAAIYSSRYRAFVERITGLPPNTLTEQVDCAANCHAPGCHLLCHDDVIGTRKVSYILYLTERGWTSDEGGALELYEAETDDNKRRVPKPHPIKTILPAFNSMAYFVVEPGASFHSVQEVFGERPRLSIQGWYHAKETPQHMEEATLSRLKSTGKGEDTEGDFVSFGEGKSSQESCLSKSDRQYLSKYINKTYLTEQSIKEIRERFEEDSSVQLRHFLSKEWVEKMKAASGKEDNDIGKGKPALDYSYGCTSDWRTCGPAHKQRFLEYVGKVANSESSASSLSCGPILGHLKRFVFESLPYARFLEAICSLGHPLGYRGRVRRFRPGLDYTVAHYGILTTQAVLDATLCFAAGNGEQCRVDESTGQVVATEDDAQWESGDCGGFECYIAADDDDDCDNEEEGAETGAADEYNDEDDTELLSVSASNNTLSLVYRDPGTMRFVKYVGCQAPSSRWDISMEYEVNDDNDDEQGEKEDTDHEDQ